MLYGKNCDDSAMESTVRCSKNLMIADLANQWPRTGIRGPTHKPVTIPIAAATITSGMKYPASKGFTLMSKLLRNWAFRGYFSKILVYK